MRIRTTDAADEDAVDATRFYLRSSKAAAAAFVTEFLNLLEFVREWPLSGSSHVRGTRRKHFPRFPYSLIYFLQEDLITVVAVMHDRREPEYWADRSLGR